MAEATNTMKRILDSDCCSGCGLCATAIGAGKIDMQNVEPGFIRPVCRVPLSKEENDILNEICPGIQMNMPPSGLQNHPIWGPFIQVRVGAAMDDSMRHAASSGGVLSALLSFLLESGEVDHVVHTAASTRSPIENQTIESDNREKVLGGAGSRYCPSSPLKDFEAHLSRGKAFALLGKPCDIAGVRALGKRDPRVQKFVPYLLSFFCAGVPSLAGVREILKEMSVNEHDLTSFRYRGEGWPGCAAAKTGDGKVARMNYADSWGKILSKHLQFRCKICPDGTGGFADVVCGDAWHCDELGYPLFEEREGRSLIITRTPKGEDLVKTAIAAGYIDAEAISIEEVEKMQPAQARRKKMVLARLFAMRLFGGVQPSFSGLKLFESARLATFGANVRSFLGMFRRLLLQKIYGS